MPKKRRGKNPVSKKKQSVPRADKGTPRLRFMNGGQWQGFTNSAVSSFNNVDPSSTIREFIQNSLDAAVQAGKKTAEINFIVQDTNCSEIPGMEEYKNALDSSIKEHEKRELYNKQSKQVAKKLLKASDKPSFPTLFVIDNGIGFDKKLLTAMCGDGSSQKGDDVNSATGSYGNGHLTAFSLSELQYIFYGGVRQNNSIFGGHAIISSHKEKDNKSYGKDGYYACNLNPEELYDQFSFLTNKEDMPNFVKPYINSILEQGESGAIIAVPAFNNFKKDADKVSDLIIQCAAINFFVAIHREALRINVKINNQNTPLNKNNLGSSLDKYKNQMRSIKNTNFPSGFNAWSSYQTLIKGEKKTVNTGHGTIQMYVRKDSGEKNIVLCRNGMWISKNFNRLRRDNFANKKPFDLIILAEDSTTSVYNVFKAAEGPLHDDIRQHLLDDDDRKKFKECLDNIFRYINELIADSPTKEFSPTDFVSIRKGEVVNPGGKNSEQSEFQGQKATDISYMPKDNKTRKKKKSQRPSSPGSTISVKMSSRQTNSGVIASFIPSGEIGDEYNAEFRMSIDKGSDATCTSSLERYDWDKIRFKSVKINNEKIPESNFIKDGDKVIGINIGVIKAKESYKMEIEYDKHLPIAGNYTISPTFFRRKKNSQPER